MKPKKDAPKTTWSEQERSFKVNQKAPIFQDRRTKRARDKHTQKRRAIEDSSDS